MLCTHSVKAVMNSAEEKHFVNNKLKYIFVIRHDRKLGGGSATEVSDSSSQPNIPTQQFGVTLQYIKQHYSVIIPPVVRQCVEFLDKPDGNNNSIIEFDIICLLCASFQL